MASSTRFEYSHEKQTIRIADAITRAQFCTKIKDTKVKYGLSLLVPILLNLSAQVWKPSAYTYQSWVAGNAIVFNEDMYVEEEGGAKAAIFCMVDLIDYTDSMNRWKLRIQYGNDENFSDVKFAWKQG